MVRSNNRSALAAISALLLGMLSACREVSRPSHEPAVARVPTRPTPVTVSLSATASEAPSGGAPSPAPPRPEWGKRIDMTGEAMGTRVAIAAYVDANHNEAQLRRAVQGAFDEVLRLEGLMTPWRADSELSKVNAGAGAQAVAVGPEMLAVIEKSLWVSEHSDGVFDVTFASMGKLWRFNHDMDGQVPPARELATARKRIDYRRVKVDREKKTIFLERADQKLDFGGIAKGYAVDRAADVLEAAGLAAYYVQAGGDLYVKGKKPDGSPWRVGVRDPRGPEGSFFARLPVENHAFSTAGDYERSFVKDGKRYHHIIDPRTGYPATATRSVTIWARDAFTADAIDDAVFILGPQQGLALVESIDDCGAVIVDAANKVWVSKRLEGLLEVLRPPSGGL